MQLFDYHLSANERLLVHLRGLPKDIFNIKVGSAFPTIAKTFAHIIAVDELWYFRLKGESLQRIDPDAKEFKTPEGTIKEFIKLHQKIKHFLLTIDDVERVVVYQNTNGDQVSNKIRDIVQHNVNHGTYHRGNVSA